MIENVLAPLSRNSGTLVNVTVNEPEFRRTVAARRAAGVQVVPEPRDARRARQHSRGRLEEAERIAAPNVRLPLAFTHTDS